MRRCAHALHASCRVPGTHSVHGLPVSTQGFTYIPSAPLPSSQEEDVLTSLAVSKDGKVDDVQYVCVVEKYVVALPCLFPSSLSAADQFLVSGWRSLLVRQYDWKEGTCTRQWKVVCTLHTHTRTHARTHTHTHTTLTLGTGCGHQGRCTQQLCVHACDNVRDSLA